MTGQPPDEGDPWAPRPSPFGDAPGSPGQHGGAGGGGASEPGVGEPGFATPGYDGNPGTPPGQHHGQPGPGQQQHWQQHHGQPGPGHQQHWQQQYGQQQYDQPGYSQPPYGQAGGNPYGPSTNPYQQGYGYQAYSRSSQATTALILSLSGFFCCAIGAVVGAAMGKSEMNAIDRGESDPSQRGTAQAAFVLGLIIIGLHVIPLLLWGVAILSATGSAVAP